MSGAACGPWCGYCGGCTAAWEREREDETEVCANCMGRGEVNREDGSDQLVVAVCLECDGKGWTA